MFFCRWVGGCHAMIGLQVEVKVLHVPLCVI